ncbi:GGDEF/GAF/EAL domain protein [Colwellia psychrerythraea 34H]|uniref:GGDEF/GAF/EAL domain protein n=1 Tax=Colwellia psychrerythraea (strain 34H / ATCC BAA-681) TaxID=167879 RepID=Q486Y3_COLP3|nr:GGDEF/GAF/EAL domain protein [Colwellia psychrerythraea 34H]
MNLKSKVPSLISISPEASIALGNFTLAITEAVSEKEIYNKLAENLPKILQADRGSVTLITENKDEFEVFSLQGPEGMLSIGKYFSVDNSLAGLAVQQEKTIISKLNADRIEIDAQQLYQQDLLSIMNSPLQFSDRIIGTVNIGSYKENAYDSTSLELLTLVSTLVSNYLERQHLLEQAQIGVKQYKTYSKQLESLNHVAEELCAATNESEVFSIITRSASHIISAQRISYCVPNYKDKCFEIRSVFSENEVMKSATVDMENSALQFVLQSGSPQFFENLAVTNFTDHLILSKNGLCSGWSVPVRVKGEIVGLLNAASNVKINERAQQLGVIKMLSGIMGVTLSRVNLQEQLEHQACYDTLTGLPNRHQFNQRMELAITQDNPIPFTLLFIDLDRFKVVNDTMGHDVGDELLCRVTQRINQQIRKEDFAARHGGDEFVVLLLNKQSKAIADITSARIIKALKEPFQIDEHSIFIGASIGISYFPEHSKNSEELLKYADIAMYHAKKQGKSSFKLYSSRLSDKIHCRQKLETLLRLAVKNEELHLVFQPQINEDGVFAIEALLRWEDPELGVISADEFIPIAEESLLIEEITHWVINQSLQMIARLRLICPSVYVAVNISAKNCLYPEKLKHCILTGLNDANLPGSALELEVTENVFLQNVHNTNKLFKDLGHYGIRFAIDDFGTGYSSLTYLLNLPLNTLKIDRSFIQDIHCNKIKLGVVKGILVIAKSLSMNCLAEGVEIEAQKQCLEELGCNRFQGYYFSKPLREKDFLLYLKSDLLQKS